jgi:uracil phosphoribosyltransferase
MDLRQYKNVTLLNHPLLKHKITIIRDKNTGTMQFRQLVKEISVLEGYEVLRDLPLEEIEVETPIEKTMQPTISGKKLCFVPILRAGLGMVDGFLELVPTAKVGHIGLYRNEKTKEPVEYFCKLPSSLNERTVYLLDPMLATGGSAIDAVKQLKKHGAEKIIFVCIIAAPEGVKAFCEKNPDIPLYIGALDRCLNENSYICPGLGDAGDRIFGTLKN